MLVEAPAIAAACSAVASIAAADVSCRARECFDRSFRACARRYDRVGASECSAVFVACRAAPGHSNAADALCRECDRLGFFLFDRGDAGPHEP